MRVMLGVHQFFPSKKTGTEVLTLELARGLRILGHEVHIFTAEPEDDMQNSEAPWWTSDQYDQFQVHRLHYGAIKQQDPIAKHFSAPNRVSKIVELASQLKPDIVHFHHIINFSAESIAAVKGKGIPVLFTPTDYWVVCPKITLFRDFDHEVCEGPNNTVNCVKCFDIPKWAAKPAMLFARPSLYHLNWRIASIRSLEQRVKKMITFVNQADAILPSTQFLAEVLIRYGLEKNKIKVMPYGVDIGRLPAMLPIPDVFNNETPLRLGFIGTISMLKGPHVLVKALALIKNKNSRVSLDIYGDLKPDDGYQAALKKDAESMEDIIHFRGRFPHEKIGEILRGLHILIVPSIWYESVPLVLLSALNAGITVIVSRLGGLTEPVKEGHNGFSFPSGDSAALAEIINDILSNPNILQKQRSLINIKQRSSTDYTVDIENEYKALL